MHSVGFDRRTVTRIPHHSIPQNRLSARYPQCSSCSSFLPPSDHSPCQARSGCCAEAGLVAGPNKEGGGGERGCRNGGERGRGLAARTLTPLPLWLRAPLLRQIPPEPQGHAEEGALRGARDGQRRPGILHQRLAAHARRLPAGLGTEREVWRNRAVCLQLAVGWGRSDGGPDD